MLVEMVGTGMWVSGWRMVIGIGIGDGDGDGR